VGSGTAKLAVENSARTPLIYIRNIQKGKTEKKSLQQAGVPRWDFADVWSGATWLVLVGLSMELSVSLMLMLLGFINVRSFMNSELQRTGSAGDPIPMVVAHGHCSGGHFHATRCWMELGRMNIIESGREHLHL
jgi:hypothetical protein